MDIVDISVVDTVGDGVGVVDTLEPTSMGLSNIEKSRKFSVDIVYFKHLKLHNPISRCLLAIYLSKNFNIITQYTSMINLLPVVVPSVEVVVEPSS